MHEPSIFRFTKIANPVDKRLVDALWSNSVVSLSGRLVHDRNRIHWTFELITSNIPLIGLHQRHGHASDGDSYARVTVVNTSVSPDGATKCADDLISTMCAFGRFYDLIVRFAPIYKNYMQEFCRVISLSANRMVLSYGPNEKSFFVMLQWKQQDSSFHLSFGSHTSTAPKDGKNASKPESEDGPKSDYGNVAENPHSLMAAFVQTTFNEKRDLAYLMQYLSDTIEPLLALHRLPQWPTLGVGENQNQPIGYGHLFTILPISGTVVRVLYKWHVCFEVKMMANGEVALRDCGAQTPATVRQEALKNAAKFMPIVGFKVSGLENRLLGLGRRALLASWSSWFVSGVFRTTRTIGWNHRDQCGTFTSARKCRLVPNHWKPIKTTAAARSTRESLGISFEGKIPNWRCVTAQCKTCLPFRLWRIVSKRNHQQPSQSRRQLEQ